MCGDSTQREAVQGLMGGEKADMVFTDPPYGVSYSDSSKMRILGDQSQVAIPLSFKNIVETVVQKDARLYFCGGCLNSPMYFALFEQYLRQQPKIIIWVKDNFVLSHNGYHRQYELIFFGWLGNGGGKDYWFGSRKGDDASDVWSFHRDEKKDVKHPTQKPVGIPMRAICNSCPSEGIVFDPFAGSGSTLLACEQTGRKCYSCEIDPKYCQVVIDRWEKFTGEKAVKIQS